MTKEETCKKLFNIFESDATADLDIADCGTNFFRYMQIATDRCCGPAPRQELPYGRVDNDTMIY